MLPRPMLAPATQTARKDDPDDESVTPPLLSGVQLNDRQTRLLRIAVTVMGVLIVLGLVALIGRIIYLVARPGPQSVAQSSAISPEVRAVLPASAQIRTISMQGDRLAIHYDSPGGSGIAIIDLLSGKQLSRVLLVPEPPKP